MDFNIEVRVHGLDYRLVSLNRGNGTTPLEATGKAEPKVWGHYSANWIP